MAVHVFAQAVRIVHGLADVRTGLTLILLQERSKFFKEMRLMMRMRHHSIVRCFGGAQARQEGERDVMVLEYIPGGTLDHYVHEHRRDSRLSLNEVLVIATDLADVLRYLHRNGIVHQDLKPSNILLNEKGEVKLTDFGISKIKRSTYLSRFMVGTPSYTAPEVWRADAVSWTMHLYLASQGDIFAIPDLVMETVHCDVRLKWPMICSVHLLTCYAGE